MLATTKRILFSAPILLALAALGWGGNTIAARVAVGEVSPMMLVSIRWLMVSIMLITIYPRAIREALFTYRDKWPWLLGMGFGLSGFNIMFYLAAHSTSAINLGLMQSSIPAIIMLLGLVIFRIPVTGLQFIGLLIAMTGAVRTCCSSWVAPSPASITSWRSGWGKSSSASPSTSSTARGSATIAIRTTPSAP